MFTDLLKSDAMALLADFGEAVVCRAPGGAERTIMAIVDRDPPPVLGPAGDLRQPKLRIEVANDAAAGIASDQVDARGAYQVKVSRRIGLAAEWFGCYLPEGQAWHDVATVTLELR